MSNRTVDESNVMTVTEYEQKQPSAASAGSPLIDEMAAMLREMKRRVTHNSDGYQCYGCEVAGRVDRLLARYKAGER